MWFPALLQEEKWNRGCGQEERGLQETRTRTRPKSRPSPNLPVAGETNVTLDSPPIYMYDTLSHKNWQQYFAPNCQNHERPHIFIHKSCPRYGAVRGLIL
jgi:hypothetical protein